MNLDFLFSEEEVTSDASLPEGGSFVQGNISLWHSQVMWRTQDNIVHSTSDLQAIIDDMDEKPTFVHQAPFGTFYYFAYSQEETARVLNQMNGQEYPPNLVWNWRTKSSDILNWGSADGRTAEDIFGEYMNIDVAVSTYGSDRSRHELHMYALPSFVQAMCMFMAKDERAKGMFADDIKWPIFDFDDLGNINTDNADTEFAKSMKNVMPGILQETQAEWIGTDGKNYPESKLWAVRKDIWNATGEDDVAAYTLKDGKYKVGSPVLRRIISYLYSTMEKNEPVSLWARVNGRVPDLRANAVTNWKEAEGRGGNRLSLMVVNEIYGNKEEAENAAGGTSDDDGFMPTLPDDWKGAGHDQFLEWAKGYLGDKGLLGKPWPIAKGQLNNDDLQQNGLCTVDDIKAWWGFLS